MNADGMMKYPGLCMVVPQIKLHAWGQRSRLYARGHSLELLFCKKETKQVASAKNFFEINRPCIAIGLMYVFILTLIYINSYITASIDQPQSLDK